MLPVWILTLVISGFTLSLNSINNIKEYDLYWPLFVTLVFYVIFMVVSLFIIKKNVYRYKVMPRIEVLNGFIFLVIGIFGIIFVFLQVL